MAVFGALLIVVVLFFVPYRRTTVSTQSGASGIGLRTTTEDTGSTLLLSYLRMRGEKVSSRTGARATTTLRGDVYAFRVGAVILLAVLDYLLFCLWPRRGKRPEDSTLDLGRT